jgi:molybdate transport system substrate-binding protein
MSRLHILSGGAANGLVNRVQDRFTQHTGLEVAGTFSAVGQMKEALLAGQPCDVAILTESMIKDLCGSGHLDAGSVRRIGVVQTGLGVPQGQWAPDMNTPEQLAQALLQADGVYMADPLKATAGIHFMKVLRSLALEETLGPRLLPFPNGQTAMAAMAARASQSPAARLIGCTQVTEILNTPGVTLAALLPPQFELATPYTAAVSRKAAQPEAAAHLIALLADAEQAALRKACGFD